MSLSNLAITPFKWYDLQSVNLSKDLYNSQQLLAYNIIWIIYLKIVI